MGSCIAPHQLHNSSSPLPSLPTDPSDFVKQAELILKPSKFIRKYHGRLEAKYRMGRMIGCGEEYAGTYGKVFEAVHLASGTQRAVKVIEKELIPESLFTNFLPEVQILKSLVSITQDHPHIIKIYEVIVESDNINVVFELCTGGELLGKFGKRIEESAVANYMFQILAGLAYCHDRKIAHRDIKPENLLFETSDQNAMLKIADFGTAETVKPGERLRNSRGTVRNMQLYYLAPEVLSGQYDEKCDIWSCGIILYFLLLGELPDLRRDDVVHQLNTSEANLPQVCSSLNCSASAKDFLQKLLTFNHKQRPSARTLLSHTWLQANRRREPITKNCEISRRMKEFSVRAKQCGKLKHAALMYIASQLTSLQETELYRRKFIEMDVDRDGRLGADDLSNLFPLMDTHKILFDCNPSCSGALSYTEFLTASLNWQSTLSDTRITTAFYAFDDDLNGKILIRDVQNVFAGSTLDANDEEWAKVVREANGQGAVSLDLKEFRAMMRAKQASRLDSLPTSSSNE